MSQYLLPTKAGILRRALAVAAVAAFGITGQASAQTATQVFQHWSLRVSNQDSAAVRSSNVTATTPTLRRLVPSNNQPINDAGNTRVAVPTYSSRLGLAFAPVADGSGWASTLGGPGGTVNRRFFVQFVINPTAGSTVRVDSVIARSGFMLTASNTFMAVAYSRSGFVSDSTVITGGKGPSGPVGGGFPALPNANPPVPADGPAPIQLSQINTTTGNVATYRLALNAANGVTITAPQTLTIRLYFSCSASAANASRYALLKDVTLKSRQALVTSARSKAVAGLQVYPNPVQNRLTVAHPGVKAGSSITIFSATGQKVACVTPQPGTAGTEVDLSRLTNGIYLVEYRNGNERVTGRVVKE